MENSKTLLFGLIEKKTQSTVHDKIELNVSDYPELEGLSDSEIKYYVTENCHTMKSLKPEYESLWHELVDQKVVIEKTTEEKQELYKEKD
jgi:hypothetical protein